MCITISLCNQFLKQNNFLNKSGILLVLSFHFVFRKNQKHKPIKISHKVRAVNIMMMQEQNNIYLENPYVTTVSSNLYLLLSSMFYSMHFTSFLPLQFSHGNGL